jgi:parvulin-like peptidyl-prolyl isomerase
MVNRTQTAISFVLLALVVAACNRGAGVSATLPPNPSSSPAIPSALAQTSTPFPPSPTPVPLAARVDGLGITLAEYQVELALYQAARQAGGTNLATDAAKRVQDDLIDQTLLAQAAQEAGFVVDEATLQAHLDRLSVQLGSAQALTEWISAHGFSEEVFRLSLERAIAAAWMRDQIINAVPTSAEQIHARQILLYNSGDANRVLSQLDNGADFVTLAVQYDPVMGGDLGWFPRGYLTEPAVEEAAFTLEPGKYSTVIETRLGYHIVQVIERDPQRLLEPSARLILQAKALQSWLKERRSQSDIQILVP